MSHLTQFQTFLLLSILKVVVVLVITLTAVSYTVLLERKFPRSHSETAGGLRGLVLLACCSRLQTESNSSLRKS